MSFFPAFIVDAFTKEPYAGNQAAVCLIPKELKKEDYQKIAAEFNLSETAFPIPIDGDFKTASKFSLRWFTPKTEVSLCGHATLATSHVLINEIGNQSPMITFVTLSGNLTVARNTHGSIEMNFPQYSITSVRFSDVENTLKNKFPEFDAPNFLYDVIKCLIPASVNIESVAYASAAKKLIVVIDRETTKFELSQLEKDYSKMLELHPEATFLRGVIVTLAPAHAEIQGFIDSEGVPYDYVCRYFAPWVGINEDPATGSAQCALVPFWSTILGKQCLYAFQSFPNRGAQFKLQLLEKNRLSLIGQSVTVVSGNIRLHEAIFY